MKNCGNYVPSTQSGFHTSYLNEKPCKLLRCILQWSTEALHYLQTKTVQMLQRGTTSIERLKYWCLHCLHTEVAVFLIKDNMQLDSFKNFNKASCTAIFLCQTQEFITGAEKKRLAQKEVETAVSVPKLLKDHPLQKSSICKYNIQSGRAQGYFGVGTRPYSDKKPIRSTRNVPPLEAVTTISVIKAQRLLVSQHESGNACVHENANVRWRILDAAT